MVRYAYASEDKEARRDAILAAALTLFLDDTRRLPSVAAIAAKAGLAKGTVYLYFATKEEIFAGLLSKEWTTFLATIEEGVAEAAGREDAVVARFIDRSVAFLASHPYFMRLDSLGYGQLEASLPPDGFWAFKESFSATLVQTGRSLDRVLSLDTGKGLQLLLRSYALARGLFQTLDFPDHIRNDARFGKHPLAHVDFTTELRTALTEYCHGALASMEPQSGKDTKRL